jgi:hypothetical protein
VSGTKDIIYVLGTHNVFVKAFLLKYPSKHLLFQRTEIDADSMLLQSAHSPTHPLTHSPKAALKSRSKIKSSAKSLPVDTYIRFITSLTHVLVHCSYNRHWLEWLRQLCLYQPPWWLYHHHLTPLQPRWSCWFLCRREEDVCGKLHLIQSIHL